MLKPVIRIAKRFVNVLTNKDPRDFAWSSEFIADMVVRVMNFSGGGQYAHGLGYTPQFRLFMDFDGDGKWKVGNAGETQGYVSYVSVDDTHVHIRSGVTHPIYVMLLANSLDRPD